MLDWLVVMTPCFICPAYVGFFASRATLFSSPAHVLYYPQQFLGLPVVMTNYPNLEHSNAANHQYRHDLFYSSG
jgi:hypothetical protein